MVPFNVDRVVMKDPAIWLEEIKMITGDVEEEVVPKKEKSKKKRGAEEEGAAVVEEFYSGEFDNGLLDKSVSTGIKPGLADKLNQKAAKLNGVEGVVTVL